MPKLEKEKKQVVKNIKQEIHLRKRRIKELESARATYDVKVEQEQEVLNALIVEHGVEDSEEESIALTALYESNIDAPEDVILAVAAQIDGQYKTSIERV